MRTLDTNMNQCSQNANRPLDWRTFIVSLNFLLSILGYMLTMALLSPLGTNVEAGSGDNAYFTYPYRAFQISVALLAFWSVRNRPFPRITWKIGLISVFWGLYFIRAFWDLVVSPPYNSTFAWNFTPGRELYFICYVFVDFIPLLAVLKGWDLIDFPRILRWLLVLGGIGLLFSLQNMQRQVAESWTGELGRVSATRMLHTQALGNFGCYVAIAAFGTFFNYPKILWKAVAVIVGLLAAYMMIKAGSRGPAFGFVVVICAWFSVRNKNLFLALFLGIFALGFLLLFQEQILDVIKEISPTMESRLRSTLEHGDTSGRDRLWTEYWTECLQNPIFGFQLERLGHPHNMFIDGLMMFGLVAGWIVPLLIVTACFSIVKALRMRIPNAWWVLFLLGQLTQSFTQSGFSGLAIQAPLLLLFIHEVQMRKPVTPLGNQKEGVPQRQL